MVEVSVTLCWLSGAEQKIQISSNATPRGCRQKLRDETKHPFLSLYSEKGELLEFDCPVGLQLFESMHDHVIRVIVQQPQLCTTSSAATIWCPHNPFLDSIGAIECGGDRTPISKPRMPLIKKVLGGYNFFLALTEANQFLLWGDAPDFLKQLDLNGPLSQIIQDRRSTAMVWDNRNVDIWSTRWRNQRHRLSTIVQWKEVRLIQANEFSIAAVLTNGMVVAHGSGNTGGTVPQLVNDHAKNTEVTTIVTASRSFCLHCADGSAVTWGTAAPAGLVMQRPVLRIEQICATSAAFAALWNDASVTAWGDPYDGGDCFLVRHLLQGVLMIGANDAAFVAITPHRIITWGDGNYGGLHAAAVTCPITAIHNTSNAFAVIDDSMTVKVWGNSNNGGTLCQSQLDSVLEVKATTFAFAALLLDRTVRAWGNPKYGGDTSDITTELREVMWLDSNRSTFFAYRRDHVLWFWGCHNGHYCYSVGIYESPSTTPMQESISPHKLP